MPAAERSKLCCEVLRDDSLTSNNRSVKHLRKCYAFLRRFLTNKVCKIYPRPKFDCWSKRSNNLKVSAPNVVPSVSNHK